MRPAVRAGILAAAAMLLPGTLGPLPSDVTAVSNSANTQTVTVKAVAPRRARVEKRQASRKAKRNKYPCPHQSNGERARRMRQIAAGQLTVSNGLYLLPVEA